MDKIYDAAIIGGGAAGLSAAVFLIKNGFKNLIILEKENRVGKRILVTGNGKCNLSNRNITAKNYRGDKDVIENTLNMVNTDNLLAYFKSIGLMTMEDNAGRIYPFSEQASTVLDVLRHYTENYELCNFRVTEIKKENDLFLIKSENSIVKTKKVIVSTGGIVQPKIGANGDGYVFAKKIGHTVINPLPSLSPIYVDDKIVNSLKGIRQKCKVSLVIDNKKIRTEQGEVQFNSDNLSGICIFQLSSYVNRYFESGKTDDIFIQLKLFEGYKQKDILEILLERKELFSELKAENIFMGFLNKRISLAIMKYCKIESSKRVVDLTDEELKCISKTVNDWRFYPIKKYDYDKAQVTSGGITSKDLNIKTFESRLVKGMYFIGEELNVDGDCGGYNLHFAFSSGIICAKDILNTITH